VVEDEQSIIGLGFGKAAFAGKNVEWNVL